MKKIITCLLIAMIAVTIFGTSTSGTTNVYAENKSFEAANVKSLEMSSAIRLKELGVLKGTGQGFKLDNQATRLEALIILIRLLGKEKDTDRFLDAKCKFTDVPSWGIKYVNYALHNNLTKGISNKTFGSQLSITPHEFATFLLRALGYNEAAGDFSLHTAIKKSVSLGMITMAESSTYTSGTLNRGALAFLSGRALDTKIKSGKEQLIESLKRLPSSLDTNGFNVKELGAAGNGKTNDTAAIQEALDRYDSIFIPNGIYMIDGTQGLRPRSNQTIRLSEHAVLKIIPNNKDFKFLFYLSDISNTHLEGGTIAGDRLSYTEIDGDGGSGIAVGSNNKNITIKNMKIKEFWGDGLVVGDDNASRNIKLESIICSNNSRHGLSIKNVRDMVIETCLFETSNGSSSEEGIHVGTRTGGMVKNLSILNTWVINHDGNGMSFNGDKGEIDGVQILNCFSGYNDCGVYLKTCKNIIVKNSGFSHNNQHGLSFIRDINGASFTGVSSLGNGSRGVSLVVSEQITGTRDISFNSCLFSNNSRNAAGKSDGVRIDNYDSSQTVEQIKFISCRFIDNQQVPTQRYGLTVGFGSGIGKIIVETNCLFKGNILNDMLSNNLILIRVPETLKGALNIKDSGAEGDGITDDTAAIQRALKASSQIIIPKGVYLINTRTGLKISSNQSVIFESGAVFKAIPNSEDFYSILDLSGVKNVSISGGIFIGDRYSHLGKGGEWGKGIYINSDSQNISIVGSKFKEFWGDGLYIGGKIAPKNIRIKDVICERNLRSGISVTNVNNLTIANCVFTSSNGVEPKTGINIEPGLQESCEDITISDSKIFDNLGHGISLLGKFGVVKNVKIINSQSYRNAIGLYIESCEDIDVKSSILSENKIYGLNIPRDILNGNFSNLVISKNNSIGAALVTTSQRSGLENLIFNQCIFSDNGRAQPNEKDGMRIDAYDLTGKISNLKFYSCSFIDNQVMPTQRYGISINTSEKVFGIFIDDKCYFKGNKKGSIFKF